MNAIALSILGALLGHPAMGNMPKRFDHDIEELDNIFDDGAYDRAWRPWEWQPGLCINCCHDLKLDQFDECEHCGWLQGAA